MLAILAGLVLGYLSPFESESEGEDTPAWQYGLFALLFLGAFAGCLALLARAGVFGALADLLGALTESMGALFDRMWGAVRSLLPKVSL